jgi:hypothetical protein
VLRVEVGAHAVRNDISWSSSSRFFIHFGKSLLPRIYNLLPLILNGKTHSDIGLLGSMKEVGGWKLPCFYLVSAVL